MRAGLALIFLPYFWYTRRYLFSWCWYNVYKQNRFYFFDIIFKSKWFRKYWLGSKIKSQLRDSNSNFTFCIKPVCSSNSSISKLTQSVGYLTDTKVL